MFVPSPQLTVTEPRGVGPLRARVHPSSVVTAPSKSTIRPAGQASLARPLRRRRVKRDCRPRRPKRSGPQAWRSRGWRLYVTGGLGQPLRKGHGGRPVLAPLFFHGGKGFPASVNGNVRRSLAERCGRDSIW